MKDIVISKRYALAFLKCLPDLNVDTMLNELKLFTVTIQSNVDFIDFLGSVLVKTSEKLDLIDIMLQESSYKAEWKSFISLLLNGKRINIFPLILEQLEHLLLSKKRLTKVKLHSARILTEDAQDKIIAKLKSILNCEFDVENIINPSLIGGFIAETESLLIDASVRKNLERFAKPKYSLAE